jgi:hypothetical protein
MALWNGLRELPSTNYRIFVSVALEVLFVVVVLGCMAMDRKLEIELVWALGVLITTWLGLGVAQFHSARKTDIDYVNAKNGAPPTVTVDAPSSQVNVGTAAPLPAPEPTPVPTPLPPAPIPAPGSDITISTDPDPQLAQPQQPQPAGVLPLAARLEARSAPTVRLPSGDERGN